MNQTGVVVAKGPTILLQSGSYFDMLDPEGSAFTIEDIAHGLSNTCRFAGQCRQFYSVAEHSVHVSNTAGGWAFAGLMHDAAEAFIGDVTRPLKSLLPEYKRIETTIERAIFARFNLPDRVPSAVKNADIRVFAAERRQVMPLDDDDWGLAVFDPAPVTIEYLSPPHAFDAFMRRYEACRP